MPALPRRQRSNHRARGSGTLVPVREIEPVTAEAFSDRT